MQMKNTVIGIELGSTRIKAVLLDRSHTPIVSGSCEWENRLVSGVWTYSYDAIREGVQTCYADLKKNYEKTFGKPLTQVGAIGISGMMHGYLPLGENGEPLAAFRTWRNRMTEEAAEELTQLFSFNIPQRWSIAHLYQSILGNEEHLPRLRYLTTAAGYIHRLLTGEHVLGIGEASGMFPIDSETKDYDASMLDAFDARIAPKRYPWKLRDVLPRVLCAGECAGYLTEAGARFLDPAGDLCPGIPFAPPEGDAGTGMTATDSVRTATGNVSAGTSDFAMVVDDHMPGLHREIDMVTTPAGQPVAMVHCSNCTSDINAWTNLFSEFSALIGAPKEKGELYPLLFEKALEGSPDCGGLVSFNYYSGEEVTHLNEGRPVFLRTPDADFSLANFMRMHLSSALATLKLGLTVLIKEEHVRIDRIFGHGGYFKTPGVGQRMLSAAVGVPVSVMESAGEGGPYGMALLAAFLLWKEDGECLADYLDNKVFADAHVSTVMADKAECDGFDGFFERWRRALPTEEEAIRTLK